MPIYKDKNGSYYFKISIKGKQILRRGYKTKEAALAAAIECESGNNNLLKNKNYPLFNDLLDSYLKKRKNELKATTIYGIKQYIDLHIRGRIRNVRIDYLIESDFTKWYNYLKKTNISIGHKNRMLKILQSVFDYAYIYYQYECLSVKRLNRFKDFSIKKPKSDYRIFTLNDFKRLYPILNEYDKLLLLTFYLFGLRIGEVQGLTVLSFKSFENTLCVYQQVTWKTSKKGYTILPPKTSTSNRNYPCPEVYIKMINKHIDKNNLIEENFIFFGLKKKDPLSCNAIYNKLKKWSKIVGYHLKPHLFRHSAVSQLYANKVPLEVIKSLVGHSSVEITKDVYLHQTKEKKDAMLDFMNKLIIDI